MLFGVIGTGLAVVLAKLQMASLWDFFMQVIGLSGGALAGLFALGIFTTRGNGKGALVDAAAGAPARPWPPQPVITGEPSAS